SDDAGDEHEHYRHLGGLHALLPDRKDATRRRKVAVAKPGEGPSRAAAGPADHRRRVYDHDACPLPWDSPDGGVRRRGAERVLSDGDFLAPVVMPWAAGASGARDGGDAALARRVA